MTVKAQDVRLCPTCKGKGWEMVLAFPALPSATDKLVPKACPACHGTGREKR